jgi:hypothetical protein
MRSVDGGLEEDADNFDRFWRFLEIPLFLMVLLFGFLTILL